jgi:hypothetical protein
MRKGTSGQTRMSAAHNLGGAILSIIAQRRLKSSRMHNGQKKEWLKGFLRVLHQRDFEEKHAARAK